MLRPGTMRHSSPPRAVGFASRMAILGSMLAAGLLAACGSDGDKTGDTLPPIATTTTTTTMPPTTTTIPDSYVIQQGDTLFSIATMFGLDTDVLAAYNNIVNKNDIKYGQKLKIPQPGEVTTTVATTVPGSSIDSTTTSLFG